MPVLAASERIAIFFDVDLVHWSVTFALLVDDLVFVRHSIIYLYLAGLASSQLGYFIWTANYGAMRVTVRDKQILRPNKSQT